MDVTRRPSPNFDERALPVSMIVLHYTGMPYAEGALDRLTSPEARVSAHYCVKEDGEVIQLVDEEKRAWHAGKSYWRGITDVNSASVGIEIVNPGHEFGYRPFRTSRLPPLSRWLPTSRTATGLVAATSSGIPISRPRAKRIRASFFPGGNWQSAASRCRARHAT